MNPTINLGVVPLKSNITDETRGGTDRVGAGLNGLYIQNGQQGVFVIKTRGSGRNINQHTLNS